MISAMLGVGGGFLLVPVLNGILGVPMHLAVGSTACYVLGPATTSLLYRRTKPLHWRLPLILSGGLLIGVLLGVGLLDAVTRAANGQRAELLVLGTYYVLLTGLGLFSLWETTRQEPIRRGWLAGFRLPPTATLAEWDQREMSLAVLGWFGVLVGFLSGLLGISGGLLVLPGLIYLFGLPSQESVVCSLIVVWLVSFESTIVHAWHENIELSLVAAMLAGGTIGARFGTTIGRRMRSFRLRQAFGLLALGTAVLVAVRLLRLLVTG